MNTLCENILQCIDSIDDECTEAQHSVIEASIDLAEKYVEMFNVSTHCGYVQEGKFADFMAYDPNEKVIKTILLAIPRFIMAIIQRIQEKWRRYKLKNKCARISDTMNRIAKLEDEVLDLSKFANDWYTDAPPGIIFDTNAGPCVSSKIINIHGIKDYYEQMKETFLDYANAIEDGSEKVMTNFSSNLHSHNELFKKYISPTTNMRNYAIRTSDNDFNEMTEILAFPTYHEKVVTEIDKAMKDLNKWVNDILNNAGKTKITKDIANRLLEDGRNLHDIFVSVDTTVFNAINETINTWYAGFNYIDNAMQARLDARKTATKKTKELKDLKEKTPEFDEFRDLEEIEEKEAEMNGGRRGLL